MTPLENLLIVIVVIMLVYSMVRVPNANDQIWRCVNTSGNMATIHAPGCKCPACANRDRNAVEVAATKEMQEKFTNCGADVVSNSLSSCGVDSDFSYAINDFGAPGADFNDWVKSNAIDPDVVKNHNTYVIDRSNGDPNSQNRIGGTVSYDSLDQFNYMPFTGLSRPQALPAGVYCNPAMVPEVNLDTFAKCPTIRTGERNNCGTML